MIAIPRAAAPYFNAAKQFEQAIAREGAAQRDYTVGGESVRIRFAGQQLAGALGPAMDHLARPSVAGDSSRLTIDVWQSARAPVTLGNEDWLRAVSPLDSLGPRDFVYCQADIGMLCVVQGRRALICYRSLAEIPPWELAVPFRSVLNSWFQRTGGQIVHGAAVANGAHAVLLAGNGGAGKSSTALSCLEHPDLSFVSDDLCLLRRQPHPTVFSLYNSVKIRRENLSRFEDLRLPTLDHLPLDHGKPTFFLFPQRENKLAIERPLKAILLPRIANTRNTRITAASPADAWRALVPSTFAVIMGDRAVAARNLSRLTESLPVHWLELGTDRERIGETIAALLADEIREAA